MAEMETTTTRPFRSLFTDAIKALGVGVLISLFIFFIATTIFQISYFNRIFPGVHIHGYPVGGLTVEEAAVQLTQKYQLNETGIISFHIRNSTYKVEPVELGISLDAVRTAMDAYHFGRGLPVSDWLWQQLFLFANQIEVAPRIIFDESQAVTVLKEIATKEDQPLREASLQIQGTQVSAVPGQIGWTLDIEASLRAVESALVSYQSGNIYLVSEEEKPILIDAADFIPQAQKILNQPFTINLPENINQSTSKWTITPQNLAPMLTFLPSNKETQTIETQFVESTLLGLLESIGEKVDTPPQNPRFIFNDDTFALDLYLEGIPGTTVDIQKSAEAVQTALAEGSDSAFLFVDLTDPEVSDFATGEDLGITELIHLESSYFYGSDSARIHNIETAANEFLGVLVKPDETFSMANVMRDITLDNGYSEALIIYNGKTIDGVGGGVCQVSTTLFRTAFFAGFPIVERHPHAYRVSYYEKVSGNNRDSNLAGLDATVYIPLVDLKFSNDSPYWLLMEAYVNKAASRITWKFYSTDDGRTMDWQTTGLTNKVEAKKPIYELNTALEKGEIKQVDWEADGADVSVSRWVYRDNALLFEDNFFTRYAPWRAVYEYGPGTDGIPTENTN